MAGKGEREYGEDTLNARKVLANRLDDEPVKPGRTTSIVSEETKQ